MVDYIQSFQEHLINKIPCKTANARNDLKTKNLSNLLLTYLQWADRFVRPQRRRVIFNDYLYTSPKFIEFGDKLLAITRLIETGAELEPYLSKHIVNGHILSGKRWPASRDFSLNRHGVHHLHIKPREISKKKIKGGHGKELLFVQFYREQAVLLYLGDHKSFDDGTLETAVANYRGKIGYEINGIIAGPNHNLETSGKLARYGMSSITKYDDRLIITTDLTCSGHSIDHVMQTGRIKEVIFKLTEKDGHSLKWENLFKEKNIPYPDNPDFELHMNYCDLILLDKTNNHGYLLLPWKR